MLDIVKSRELHTMLKLELPSFQTFFHMVFYHMNRFLEKNPVPRSPFSQLAAHFALSGRFTLSACFSKYRGTESPTVEQATFYNFHKHWTVR